jgi:hypothetical protein
MDEYEVHVDKALEALRAVSYRDLMAASKALERTRFETVDLWRFGSAFSSVADERQDGEEPGSFARMHLRIAVTDAPADLPERLEDAPEPFWRHVRDAVLAYREEREEED